MQMIGKSIMEQSRSLSGLSLESFIVEVTSEGENMCFYQLLQHQQISSVKYRFRQMLKLFSRGTFSDYPQFLEKYECLTEKQLVSLKRLTLLSQFKGKNIVLLPTLTKKLKSTEGQVLEILLKMSIDGSVSIKIDQQKGEISILHAQLRMQPIEDSDELYMKGKIAQILQKNDSIKGAIKKITNLSHRLEQGAADD